MARPRDPNRKNPPSILVKLTDETQLRYIVAARRYGHTQLATFTRALLEAACRPHETGILRLFEDTSTAVDSEQPAPPS